MPSSELSRRTARRFYNLSKTNLPESLLLGMSKLIVNVVGKFGTSPGQSRRLYSSCTGWLLNISRGVVFVRSLASYSTHLNRVFAQPIIGVFYLFGIFLYTLSPTTISTNEFKKD